MCEITIADIDDSERQPVEVWTRVMGYIRPKDSANIGKRGEFAERVDFREPTEEVYERLAQE